MSLLCFSSTRSTRICPFTTTSRFRCVPPTRRSEEAEVRRKVTETAALLRIGGKLDNRATNLSGGEMQRVAIGRALVRRPSIYLMDEPLSSLDAKLRAELRLELKRIQVEWARLFSTLPMIRSKP